MRLAILYRGTDFAEHELPHAAKAGFFCTDSRMDLKPGDVVVSRYSCLPYFTEQERDLHKIGARFINGQYAHSYLADALQWSNDLGELTFPTWPSLYDVLKTDEQGPFVLKGQTNSKKFLWDTHMFAADRPAAIKVATRLQDDSLIGDQAIIVRKYVPLMKLADGLHGLPVTQEFRFFVCDGEILSGGFYWSSHTQDLLESHGPQMISPSIVPSTFLAAVIARVGSRARFMAIDVARTEHDEWLVVELNDAMMSGLSENDPAVLYPALYARLERYEQDSVCGIA